MPLVIVALILVGGFVLYESTRPSSSQPAPGKPVAGTQVTVQNTPGAAETFRQAAANVLAPPTAPGSQPGSKPSSLPNNQQIGAEAVKAFPSLVTGIGQIATTYQRQEDEQALQLAKLGQSKPNEANNTNLGKQTGSQLRASPSAEQTGNMFAMSSGTLTKDVQPDWGVDAVPQNVDPLAPGYFSDADVPRDSVMSPIGPGPAESYGGLVNPDAGLADNLKESLGQ